MASAVVFGYHNVGVRCLATVLARGVDVRLVVTHQDDPGENIWFGSVANLARLHDIPVITPDDANDAATLAAVRACAPEFLFSFYYRYMLGTELLGVPTRGAYNMHGSLLPRYRGRVPVNWALVHGETQTGASLHRMVLKPDAGELVAQEAVPILPNDTAQEVFNKVTWAAERCLYNVLPALLDGTATHTPLDLSRGSYFGRRRPEDGRIDWSRSAWEIHNLVRAVAPPYPGAFFDANGMHVSVLRSHYRGEVARHPAPRLYWEAERCYADCANGERLRIVELAIDGQTIGYDGFKTRFGADSLALGNR